MNHKLESRLLGALQLIKKKKKDCWEKYQILRYADDTTLMAEGEEEVGSFLMMVKKESEKSGMKFNIQKKLTSWHLVPLLHSQ